jgi:hypothetical protein
MGMAGSGSVYPTSIAPYPFCIARYMPGSRKSIQIYRLF